VSLVPYFPLSPDIIRRIVGMQLERIRKRVWESYRATMSWPQELVDEIARRCTESASGARNVENILARGLLPELSGYVLARLAEGETIKDVRVGIETSGAFSYQLQ
jgi:type VI secretion system protein VasG